MDELRRRLRASAGVPDTPRTTPGRLRSLVRRRRQRRRLAAVAAGVVLFAGAGAGVNLLLRSQQTQRLEFADAPSPTPDSESYERGMSEPVAARRSKAERTPSPAPTERGKSASSAPAVDPGAAPSTRRCAGDAGAGDIPDGADRRRIADVDGDDRPDIMWIDASRTLGIVTAAGGMAIFPVESAAPSAVSALAVDADEQPPVELLVSDGRAVQLLVFDDCEIVPVTKVDGALEQSPMARYIDVPHGQPWTFDLGFRGTGTGVGCIRPFEVDRRLAGLARGDSDGDRVDYRMAVLDLDGRTVTVASFAEGEYVQPVDPVDDDAIERLSQVTCEADTLHQDGVTTPTP